MLVWCERKILLAGFSRTEWQWVTKHEAVCTCSRTAQCLFRMKHIGNYLHFPCFSRTKIILMLCDLSPKTYPRQCVYIYLYIWHAIEGKLQAKGNTALSVLIMTSTLEPSWTAGETFFARRRLDSFLHPRRSRVTRWGSVFTNHQSRLLFPGAQSDETKILESPWHFLIGGMEVLHVPFRQANKAISEQPPTISPQLGL